LSHVASRDGGADHVGVAVDGEEVEAEGGEAADGGGDGGGDVESLRSRKDAVARVP
jgi:hypothetical protein